MLAGDAALAFSALMRNKMRSLLTVLGIVIGVAAVVMMQSMGRGATAYVGEAISGLGSNMLFAIPGAQRTFGPVSMGVPLFTAGDLDAIRAQARDVALVAAAGQRQLRVVHGGNNRSVNVGGVSPEYFEIRAWGVSAGRLLNQEDERQAAQVCAVGQTVVDALFAGQSPIGQDLRVQNVTCRVVGTMETKGSSAFGIDQDDVVFMPFSTFSHRIMGSDRVGTIAAAAVSKDRIDDAKDEMTQILRRRRHILPGEDDDFGVRDPREIQALLQTVTGVLTTLLAGVAAVSLVVGGIGIMNIMLVSVTERTREIGVRLAIGARAGDILAQFLVEATTLSSVGGVIGIVIGLVGAWGAARAIHVPFVLPGLATPVAFGVSVMVGVVFGVFPARKASRLNPLTALRFE
ncbi:MAG TPA: ABC transporter permease [Polyangiaceae bacterium]|nr:ABC transporter permease [Polyangiaceae bacterium]